MPRRANSPYGPRGGPYGGDRSYSAGPSNRWNTGYGPQRPHRRQVTYDDMFDELVPTAGEGYERQLGKWWS